MNPGLLAGTLVSLVVALTSYWLRLVTSGGAIAQWLLGSVLLGIGGWQWTAPMLTFFALSSLLSKTGAARRQAAELSFAKNARRDAGQVLANGGLAGLIVIAGAISPGDRWFVAFLGAVAAAAADTWGTEVGILSKASPRLVTTLARVETGRSGAVSLLGFAASLAGAASVFASAIPWLNTLLPNLFAVTGGGIVGMLADSLLGATLQAQYKCPKCEKIMEREGHCGGTTVLIQGTSWFNNDLVNAACTFIGSLTSVVLFGILA
jgi:uncharacterized protein (TIGR00297 family)